MYTSDDLRPGSPERIQVAEYSAGAACNPENVIEDWGHYDEDFTPAEQAESFEHTDLDSPHPDISFPLADSLDDLYNRS